MTRHFVGRTRELHMFDEALAAAAADGAGRLITVVGEAGIGKTRLCREVADHAENSGTVVAWGSCWPDTGAPPLWPWQALLAELRAEVRAESDDEPDVTTAGSLFADDPGDAGAFAWLLFAIGHEVSRKRRRTV